MGWRGFGHAATSPHLATSSNGCHSFEGALCRWGFFEGVAILPHRI